MGPHEAHQRSAIRRLMREAAAILTQSSATDVAPVLPKMHAAVQIAEGLDDKLPLVICEANLASMNAVCGRADDALREIERVLEVVRENDLPVPIRNFAFTKFIEIAVVLRREPGRAYDYATALVECAVQDEGSFQQYLMALFNLAVVADELLGRADEALAILSWIEDETQGRPYILGTQARRYRERKLKSLPPEEVASRLSYVESNRDALLAAITRGFLPRAEGERMKE